MRIIVIKRRWIFFIALILIITLFVIRLEGKSVPTFYLPVTNKVVAIDAGHGGMDPGAIGSLENTEAEVNLQIALKLRKLIEQNGGIVILTREDEKGLYTEKTPTVRGKKNEDLKNRKTLVNDSEPDIFISIHLNSFPQEKYYGAQTFYKKGCEESEKLAKIIQDELRNSLDKKNKREPQPRDTLYLIREVEKPSVLVEAGFLSNNKEEQLLNDSKYQEQIAWGIYIGIIKYFNEN